VLELRCSSKIERWRNIFVSIPNSMLNNLIRCHSSMPPSTEFSILNSQNIPNANGFTYLGHLVVAVKLGELEELLRIGSRDCRLRELLSFALREIQTHINPENDSR